MARSDWKRPPLEPLEPGKRRIRMTVAYDGQHYNGWQKQVNGLGVAERIEQEIHAMIGEEVMVVGSGRTDSGVHAIGQVCHFDTANQRVEGRVFAIALNRLLPSDIRIMESSEVDGTFHARYTAMARMYRYYLKRESDIIPFDAKQVWKVRKFPSIDLLNSYAACIQGTHDFTTFTARGDTSISRRRDIYESYWSYETDRFGHQVLVYTISGNAFLYRMIRSLVGSMLEFAEKDMDAASFKDILASKDRRRSGRTASPWGLYFYRVSYDPEEYAWFEEAHDEQQ
ncbi:tRNA pseudouridine(38-40) synthase TruA [Sphaerochaeta sp. PS]|uniref:tRNA pseudouridine(38-40) synthase TruA n=1 Tax=Sphaerochaeta sp. PS TaxID=3076336 RepID=UPI0028A44EBE|nr:tRNA pseudouridine(38-40) synthase TruA [Sphaerochaeta sp. PS]MDT4761212.1 tRNA pseudouridine(38-40) synthase TruA [Sphaerochaeta sp. PS]